jgi:ketosteroid isomerase-like protein
MPFVKIDLLRGTSADHLRGLSRGAHDALVAAFGMNPDDDFQIITQHEPGELVFSPTFRGGPGERSRDWTVFTIIDGVDRGPAAKLRFYRELAARLENDPGVRPEDVYVMIQQSGIDDFSFGGGVSGSETAAAESLQRLASSGATHAPYSVSQLRGVLWDFFANQSADALIATLSDEFVLRIPDSLPYGGEYVGPDGWRAFQAKTTQGGGPWESLTTTIDHVIVADGYLMAPVTTTGVAKATGETMTVENLWLFEMRAGTFLRAQLYADTGAGLRALR